MKKLLLLFFISVLSGHPVLHAQTTHPTTKKPVKHSIVKPVQKRAVPVKPKTTKPAGNLKIPAKTKPSVIIKTKITSKKTVIKEKPAKLPEGVNRNENATVVPTSKEIEMINEVNLLRKDPKAYIPFIENYMKLNARNKDIQSAGRELIIELKSMGALSQLTLNPVMYSATKQFGDNLKKEDDIDHSDLPYFENLTFGHEDIREAIIDMLIDDDDPDRGHRRNLLNKTISKIAVYEIPGDLQGYQHCFIQEFK